MAGGLIQIASYGLHDIFLIGNPQITFFKTVYKKHTNFSMEYIEEKLNGEQDFGRQLNCTLSKSGDLLHKLYLKISIPQVALSKAVYSSIDLNINSYNPYLTFKQSYELIKNFIDSVMYNLINPLSKLLNIKDITYTEIYSKYTTYINRMDYASVYNKIKSIIIEFNKTFNIPLFNGISNIIYINEKTNISSFLDFTVYFDKYMRSTSLTQNKDLDFLLTNYISQLTIIKQNIYDMLIFYQNNNNTMNRQYMKFAWVEFLGHQLVNKVEICIGNKKIDFTDSVRMNINYQLSNKILHDETYNKLIGNVSELTTYNTDIKPPYTLYVPLDFWFSKYSGLSVPLIYLRYHDFRINVELNDLINCCYYEEYTYTSPIEEQIKLNSISLIVNYIYLDTDERKKFAQLNHEYLIDQTQITKFTTTNKNISFELPFFNPVKQLYWIIRNTDNINRLKYFEYSNSYYNDIYEFLQVTDSSEINKYSPTTRNLVKVRTTDVTLSYTIFVNDQIVIYNSIYYNGTYTVKKIENEYLYIQYDYFMKEEYKYNYDVIYINGTTTYVKSSNYTSNSQAFIYKKIDSNPVVLSTLQLNGVDLFNKVSDIYSNFVQPYQHNSRTPNYGLNSYSFALQPEEYQPSGFVNFNQLDLKTMSYEFNKQYISKNLAEKTLEVLVYAFGYNILKFSHGKAGIILKRIRKNSNGVPLQLQPIV